MNTTVGGIYENFRQWHDDIPFSLKSDEVSGSGMVVFTTEQAECFTSTPSFADALQVSPATRGMAQALVSAETFPPNCLAFFFFLYGNV
jgi:hypothetical protein